MLWQFPSVIAKVIRQVMVPAGIDPPPQQLHVLIRWWWMELGPIQIKISEINLSFGALIIDSNF